MSRNAHSIQNVQQLSVISLALSGENDAQNGGQTDESQRGPSSSKQTLHEEEEESYDLEDEQADEEDVDLGGNKSARRMNVTDVNIYEVVSIREPTESKVGETEGQDQRSDDAEGQSDDEDQEAEGDVSQVRVVANNVLVVSFFRTLASKIQHVRNELTRAQ
jgi:hypothetical protein